MTSFRQGDVLLVPYPFTDQSGSKQRPAIVLSREVYNQAHPFVFRCPLGSTQVGDIVHI